MILQRYAHNDPPEIEEETNRLIEEWSNNITDDNYISIMEYIYVNASKHLKEYIDNETRELSEAMAQGILRG